MYDWVNWINKTDIKEQSNVILFYFVHVRLTLPPL